jgi:ketosteroid isomerase-like protein
LRFQTIGRVAGEDSERVLVVLEQRLRTMVSDVERAGNRIILSGLGPSSRAINRHDTTVIDVWAEDGVTAIGADVSFQASAFLGDSGQEEIMRLKLERLFEETEEQIDFERRRAEARFTRMQILASTGTAYDYGRLNERELESFAGVDSDASPIAATHEQHHEEMLVDMAMPAPTDAQQDEPITLSTEPLAEVFETSEELAPAYIHPELNEEPELNAAEAEVAVEKVQEAEGDPTPAAVALEAPEFADQPVEAGVIAAALPEAAAGKRIGTVEFPAAAESDVDDAMDEEIVEEEGQGSKPSRWIVLGLLAACIPAFLPFGVHYFQSWRTNSEVNRTIPVVSASKVVASVPARPIAAADPAELLRQWEMAMRSSDAAAQAAFYAVPVERYQKRYNVSKEAIQADKQAGIDKRKGLWTVKMERLTINRLNDTEVNVSLLKHYIERDDGKPVKEWFVPSQLRLKNEYGIWWITSERDLGRVASPGAR